MYPFYINPSNISLLEVDFSFVMGFECGIKGDIIDDLFLLVLYQYDTNLYDIHFVWSLDTANPWNHTNPFLW